MARPTQRMFLPCCWGVIFMKNLYSAYKSCVTSY